MNKLLGMMGLAKKAGQVSVGTEPCRDAMRAGKARLVIMACDVSENTAKRIGDCCIHYKTELVIPEDLTMETLSAAMGIKRLCSAVSINSADFYKGVKSKL